MTFVEGSSTDGLPTMPLKIMAAVAVSTEPLIGPRYVRLPPDAMPIVTTLVSPWHALPPVLQLFGKIGKTSRTKETAPPPPVSCPPVAASDPPVAASGSGAPESGVG